MTGSAGTAHVKVPVGRFLLSIGPDVTLLPRRPIVNSRR